jgi:hypothetical protein
MKVTNASMRSSSVSPVRTARVRVDGVEGLADDLEDDRLLRVEQVVEAADADVSHRRDALEGDALDPVLREQRPGRIEDALARLEADAVVRHRSPPHAPPAHPGAAAAGVGRLVLAIRHPGRGGPTAMQDLPQWRSARYHQL